MFPEVEEVVKNAVPYWRMMVDDIRGHGTPKLLPEASDPVIPIHREPRGSSKASSISCSF